jgi:hypothetical protein
MDKIKDRDNCIELYNNKQTKMEFQHKIILG